MTANEAIKIFTKSEKCATDDCPVTAGCDVCPYHTSREETKEAIKMAITALKNFPTQMSGTSGTDTNVGANSSEIPNSSDFFEEKFTISKCIEDFEAYANQEDERIHISITKRTQEEHRESAAKWRQAATWLRELKTFKAMFPSDMPMIRGGRRSGDND